MDRKEAIDILNDERIVIWTEPHEEEIARKQNEAIDMAIEALQVKTDGDLISRQALCQYALNQKDKSVTPNDIMRFPSAEQEQQNARIFQGIIVEYPLISTYPEYEGKPYFLIEYIEDGQDHIGYGTYKPDVLSEYLKEYFMPSAETKTF